MPFKDMRQFIARLEKEGGKINAFTFGNRQCCCLMTKITGDPDYFGMDSFGNFNHSLYLDVCHQLKLY